jgi:hypothetical protein
MNPFFGALTDVGGTGLSSIDAGVKLAQYL